MYVHVRWSRRCSVSVPGLTNRNMWKQRSLSVLALPTPHETLEGGAAEPAPLHSTHRRHLMSNIDIESRVCNGTKSPITNRDATCPRPACKVLVHPPAVPTVLSRSAPLIPLARRLAAKAAHTDRRLPVEVKMDSHVSRSRH
jgi:hypothetical protein